MDSNVMIDSLYDQLEGLSDSSRLWIWQSPKELSSIEKDRVQAVLGDFIPQWASHSRELTAKSVVIHSRFVVVALDQEVSHAASGCSIDSLTHVITQLSAEINVDLLDRAHFCLMIDTELTCVHMNDLADMAAAGLINERNLVFNALVSTKKDLQTKWLLPIGESWHKRFM